MANSFIQKLLLLFCLYLPFQLALNPAPGVDLASGRIIALILAATWFLAGLKNKKIILPFRIQTLLIISFLSLSFFSLIFSQNIGWSYRKLLFLLSFFPLYFIAADIARDSKKLLKIISCLVFGAGAAAFVGISQFLLQFIIGLDSTLKLWAKIIVPFLGASFSQAVLENSSWLVNLSGNTVFRAVSFFPDPHMFSFYLGLSLPWALALYLEEKGRKRKLFLFLFALILLADLLTFSRGGYLGLLAGFICAIFYFRKKIIFFHKKKLAGILLLLILLFAVPNPVGKRLISSFDLAEGSNAGRMETWKQSFGVINYHPFLGVGLGNYPLEIKPSANYREPIYSHNLYLDIAAETGLITLAVWILLIFISIASFVRRAKSHSFFLAGAFSLAIFSVHSFFETPLYSVHILPLLIIILALSSQQPIENKKTISTTSSDR